MRALTGNLTALGAAGTSQVSCAYGGSYSDPLGGAIYLNTYLGYIWVAQIGTDFTAVTVEGLVVGTTWVTVKDPAGTNLTMTGHFAETMTILGPIGPSYLAIRCAASGGDGTSQIQIGLQLSGQF